MNYPKLCGQYNLGQFIHSTIKGWFFLLSVFNGLVHISSVVIIFYNFVKIFLILLRHGGYTMPFSLFFLLKSTAKQHRQKETAVKIRMHTNTSFQPFVSAILPSSDVASVLPI